MGPFDKYATEAVAKAIIKAAHGYLPAGEQYVEHELFSDAKEAIENGEPGQVVYALVPVGTVPVGWLCYECGNLYGDWEEKRCGKCIEEDGQ